MLKQGIPCPTGGLSVLIGALVVFFCVDDAQGGDRGDEVETAASRMYSVEGRYFSYPRVPKSAPEGDGDTDQDSVNERVGTVRHRLVLETRMDGFEAGFQSHLLTGCCTTAPIPEAGTTQVDYGNQFSVDNVYAATRLGNTEITVGDTSFVVGRGIVLHLDEAAAPLASNYLRGAAVSHSFADERGTLSLGAGVVNGANLDDVTYGILRRDPLDTVVAMDVSMVGMDALKVGVLGAYVDPYATAAQPRSIAVENADSDLGIRIMSTGAYLDFRLGGVTAYLEGDVQTHDNYRTVHGAPVMDEVGMAAFGEISVDFLPGTRCRRGGVTLSGVYYHQWLAEGSYRGYRSSLYRTPVRYHRAPTLELDDVAVRSIGNMGGGSVYADWEFRKSRATWRLGSNLLRYNGGLDEYGRWHRFSGLTVVHPNTEIQVPLRNGRMEVAAGGGGRLEAIETPEAGYDNRGYLVHGDVAVTLVPGLGDHRISLNYRLVLNRLGTTAITPRYQESGAVLEYHLKERFSAEWSLGYSDQLHGERYEGVTIGDVSVSHDRTVYSSWRVRVTGQGRWSPLFLVVGGGTFPGGEVCDGGYCRVYPDKTEATLLFGFVN